MPELSATDAAPGTENSRAKEGEFLQDTILKIEHVSKFYPGVTALNDVSFEIKKGEVRALCGENGAGKSTLIKCIMGVEHNDKGTISMNYDGEWVVNSDAMEAQKHGVFANYQSVNIAPDLSIAENYFLGCQPKKGLFVDWKKMKQDSQKVIDKFEMHVDPAAKIRELPIAMQAMGTISKISINKDNKAEEFTLSLDLSAAGATKSIGAAIMLDGVPASAITQPVVFSDNSLAKNFNVNSNKIENGQDYAVIPLFDDAHNALGRDRYEQINTIKDHSANTNPKNISFTIKFSNPISVDELNINKLNVFIFVEGNRNQRKEIHIVGYQPTKLANTDLFGGNNDDSSTSRKRYYISKDNLAWGIMVPTDFKWPLEYMNIKSAYSLFESWVTSGGTKNEEWWKTFDSSRVYK